MHTFKPFVRLRGPGTSVDWTPLGSIPVGIDQDGLEGLQELIYIITILEQPRPRIHLG